MTKEDLKEYLHIKREREQIAAMLHELEQAMATPATSKLTGMPRNPPGEKSRIEVLVAHHTELLDRYRAMVAELDAAQAKIEDAIETLDSTQRILMRHRYIEGMKWEEICVAMNYSWRQVHRTHASALTRLK